MELNVEEKGTPICIIKNAPDKKTPVIYLEKEGERARFPFQELSLDKDQYFQVIPDPTIERNVIYLTGQSGSGKSYWIKLYCKEYAKMYPKRDIFVFSSLQEDKSLDDIKKLKRIKLSEQLLQEQITSEDFKDSLVIFDDCDVITSKPMKNKVISIMNSILETGRHWRTSICVVSHLACKGNETKTVLNECQSIVIFPKSIGAGNLKYLLNNYSSLDKEQQKKLKHVKSRWICIRKTYPNVIISEKEIFVSN